MAPLASNQAFILSNLGVLPDAWYYVGSALGLHVGAWHCSRFGAWSKHWRPTGHVALQLVQRLVNIRHPPCSCWPPTNCIQEEAQQQTAWSQRTFTNQLLLEQSSAQSLCDCPHTMHTSSSNLQHRAFVIAYNMVCRAKLGSAIKTPTIKPSQQAWFPRTGVLHQHISVLVCLISSWCI